MNGLGLNLLVCAAAVAVSFTAVMLTAIRLSKHSIVDVFWGLGFVGIAAISFLASQHSGGDTVRRATVLALTAIWGVRLAVHIGLRNRGHDEDPRYAAILKRREGGLIGYALRTIYAPQAAVMFIVSLPVQFAMYQSAPLGPLGVAGIAVWSVGFFFESVGDAQLARFKKDPANAGAIMDRGLWAWTRHPNYFGDCCVWAGMWLLAVGSPTGLITVVSPVVMAFFLVKVTGKPLLEKGMRRSRGADYDGYVARTSGFVPRPPKRQ